MHSTIISDQTLWDRFAAQQPEAQLLQSWQWGEFQKSVGREVWRLGIVQHNVVIAGMQIIGRNHGFGVRSLTVYRGPILDWGLPVEQYAQYIEQLFADLAELAHIEKATHVHVEPAVLVQTPAAHWYTEKFHWKKTNADQPSTTWLFDLQQELSVIEAQMHQKTRYNIRVAEKKNVSVETTTAPDVLIKLINDTAQRNHLTVHHDGYYRRMLESLSPTGARAHIAHHDTFPVAAILTARFGDTVTYLHGGSSDASRNVMAPYLLHWKAIIAAKESGARWYDFGGVAPEGADKKHAWFGMTRFKHGFGGSERQFIGGRERVLQHFAYRLVQLRRRLRG